MKYSHLFRHSCKINLGRRLLGKNLRPKLLFFSFPPSILSYLSPSLFFHFIIIKLFVQRIAVMFRHCYNYKI